MRGKSVAGPDEFSSLHILSLPVQSSRRAMRKINPVILTTGYRKKAGNIFAIVNEAE